MFGTLFTSIMTTLDDDHNIIFFSKNIPSGALPVLLKHSTDIDMNTRCMITDLSKEIKLVVFISDNDVCDKCLINGERHILIGIKKNVIDMSVNEFIVYMYKKFYYAIATLDSFFFVDFKISDYSLLMTAFMCLSLFGSKFEFDKFMLALKDELKDLEISITKDKFDKILEEEYTIENLFDQNYIHLFL